MNIFILSFTKAGGILAKKISENLPKSKAYGKANYADNIGIAPMNTSLYSWTKTNFKKGNGLIYIGAAGIAVRAIAPYIKSKISDPAVITVDEQGKYIVPLLSGHVGGANQLAEQLAKISGGVAVISTATDINNRFAVDSWAVNNGYYIYNPDNIKHVSASLLDNETVGISSDFPIISSLPVGITVTQDSKTGIIISNQPKMNYEKTLCLIPQRFYLGVGCRKGVTSKIFEDTIVNTLNEHKIRIESVAMVVSIELKQNEKCILDFCKKYKLGFKTYSSAQLNQLEGQFERSEFVKKTVGVDNVCERSAMMLGEELIVSKTAIDGVTVAVSSKEWRVNFEPYNGRNRL